MRARTPAGALTLTQGDLATAEADAVVNAVVNAANGSLLGGGGADGALHRAAVPAVLEACRALPAGKGIRCPPGEARLAGGYGLPARVVILAVGPVYRATADPPPSAQGEPRAREPAGMRTDRLSCGADGFPPAEASAIAMEVVADAVASIREVRFVLFSPDPSAAFRAAAVARFKASLSVQAMV